MLTYLLTKTSYIQTVSSQKGNHKLAFKEIEFKKEKEKKKFSESGS